MVVSVELEEDGLRSGQLLGTIRASPKSRVLGRSVARAVEGGDHCLEAIHLIAERLLILVISISYALVGESFWERYFGGM